MKQQRLSEPISFAVAAIVAIGTVVLAMQFPRAEEAHSGPGSFPLFLGIVMAGLAVCGIIQALRKIPRLGPSSSSATPRLGSRLPFPSVTATTRVALLASLRLSPQESDSYNAINVRANLLMSREKRMFFLTAATALYLLLMPLSGFISATAIFCMGTLMILGYRNPVRALAAGFIAAFVLYGIFGLLMNVVLPKGWIG